jgi:hypothetical protein
MKPFMKYPGLLALLLGMCLTAGAGTGREEGVTGLVGDIHTVKLYRPGDQTSFPMIGLKTAETLELHFDDFDADVKNYYYAYQLCNADWTPSILNPFEYTQGFRNVRITNYRSSSMTTSRYTHYQAAVPDRNCMPTRSGNYLLKVFINGDTSQLAFSKRFVVTDNKAIVAVQVQQPYNARYFRTHQKLNIAITPDERQVRLMGPQDLKVVVLQNNNWATSMQFNRPTIYRGNYYEYSDESLTGIPAGMEWRWADIRSLRLMSDRVESINTRRDTTQVYMRADAPRNGQMRVYYRDLNGASSIESMEGLNPFWQTEYGAVHFTFVPPGGKAFEGRDVYVFGELTNYAQEGDGLMTFNSDKGVYEATLHLKQGYYNYQYMTLPHGKGGYPDFEVTEGNNWATENSYMVLVYYRPFGAQADELIGASRVSSLFSDELRQR